MSFRYIRRPNHPLAPPSGKIPRHRVRLYDQIGPGPHPCYNCGTMVDWNVGQGRSKGMLAVAFLDGDPTHDNVVNLTPSCQTCVNTASKRKALEEKVKPMPRRQCIVCDKRFTVQGTSASFNRFCSRECRAQWRIIR